MLRAVSMHTPDVGTTDTVNQNIYRPSLDTRTWPLIFIASVSLDRPVRINTTVRVSPLLVT